MKILVGNKCDLKDEIQVSEAEAKAKAEQIGAIYMQTSAKVRTLRRRVSYTSIKNIDSETLDTSKIHIRKETINSETLT
jgi:hypothetical protein